LPHSATDLSFDNDMMWLTIADGRKLGVPWPTSLAYWPPRQNNANTSSSPATEPASIGGK